MKNLVFFISFIFLPAGSLFSQNWSGMLESTCNCLTDVLNSKTQKIAFQFGHEECFKHVYTKAIALKSADSADAYIESFLELLKVNCNSYLKCHEILDKFTMEKSEIKVSDKKTCRQVMQVGEFEDTSGMERTVISMRDSIQIVTFGELGIYTKSKVVWKDECTYNIVFIESTNPFENSVLKEGDERVIRIIDIINNEEIIYEVGMSDRWFVGQVRRIK